MKDIFFQYSKAAVKKLNEKPENNGVVVRVAKDLTVVNRSAMTRLYDDPEVEKQWLAGTTIKFVLTADLNSVKTVINPFATSKADMLTPIN